MQRYRIWLAMLLIAFGSGFASIPVRAQLSLLDEQRGVLTLAPVLKKVTPAVVNIAVRSVRPAETNPLLRDPFFRRFFGLPEIPRQREVLSAGSGVIVDAGKGYVLTNNHVVEGAEEITVTLKDKRRFRAKLIGRDPATDIALLQIPSDRLTALPLGDSDQLEVGDIVLAIGNPFALGQTVTSGIVSALGRSGLATEKYESFIQTDAPINPGNSGGALINTKGELIGINTAIIAPAGGNVGIGFAVPVNMAKAVMRQLIRYGEVRRGRIGVVIQDLTPEIAEAMGIPGKRGAVVSRVEPNSPAAAAGLRPGDVIVAVNGKPVRSSTDLRNRIGLMERGQKVTLTLLRDGKEEQVEVVIGQPAKEVIGGAEAVPQLAGATLADIPPDHPAYGNVKGVLVADVERGSPAWQVGLRPGDIILAVNREPVTSLADFEDRVRQTRKVFALTILRGNMQIFLLLP